MNRRFGLCAIALLLLLIGCSRQPSASDGVGAAAVAANNRGVGLLGQFKYAEARSVFAQLVNDHPHRLDVEVNLAIATLNRQQEGDEREALALLQAVIDEDANHLRALYCAAILLQRTGAPQDLVQAFSYLNRVVAADPQDAFAAYRVGQAHRNNGELEEALRWFQQAMETDPYLLSAYYGAQQMLRRLDRVDEAVEIAAQFNRLKSNPRGQLIKDVYTRMGPKAEALAIGTTQAEPSSAPPGPLFADAVALLEDSDAYTWNREPRHRPASITACDIDNDGRLDIFIADALRHANTVNAVLMNDGDGEFRLVPEHVLATASAVNAALWGDYDNDGLTDVYLCRRGPNQLWRQVEPDKWIDVTESTQTSNGEYDTVDGAIVDADHDGDLDIFCVNADGPNELLNNNLDGTFRAIGQDRGIAGDGRPSRQVLVTDLDRDRDADIIVINETPPHEVYLNDRLWEYHQADGVEAFVATDTPAVVAGDVDADGSVELYSLEPDWQASRWGTRWTMDSGGQWAASDLMEPPDWGRVRGNPDVPFSIRVEDFDGDGVLEVVTFDHHGVAVWNIVNGSMVGGVTWREADEIVGWATLVLDSLGGPAVIGLPRGGPPMIWRPGAGRHAFAAVRFSGMTDPGQSMRSNASGIGAHLAARIDSRWTILDTFRHDSGPGQSLQPIAIGLGGAEMIDFISIDWPDGVLQSEVHGIASTPDAPLQDLSSGHVAVIKETQRQMSSCPVLFAWNGDEYVFVSDLLGVGGLGYLVAPGVYAPPRPWENFMLPGGLLQLRNGRYVLKLAEPMEEVCYLDSLRLAVYDLPPGWSMTLDERMSILGPVPSGRPIFYRDELSPTKVVNDRGEDVTSSIAEADRRAAPVGPLDRRFIGRLRREHVLTVIFDHPINDDDRQSVLVVDGWIEYAYSQTMFAAWQASAEYRAPTVEALGADGEWRVVLDQFGYPAGMPRQMSVPLADLPPGTTQLRIRTNQEIYWDRLRVVYAEPCPSVRRRSLDLISGRLSYSGFARRTTGPQRLPHYDYRRRRPFWDTRSMTGLYTALGPVDELVEAADDALAIFGPGEEIHFEFEAATDAPPIGWSRSFVVETAGWCKDMDLLTQDGETIEPLPRSGVRTSRRDQLHERYNTRYESGR